jgi:peptidyl-prolyl cis-trans isomerase B (cyclophilin B)
MAPEVSNEPPKPEVAPPSGETPAEAPTTMEEQYKNKVAVIETNLGTIKFKFLDDVAPGHVKNFIDLAKKGFYDGTRFHRVIPGFMIQGGDPNSKAGDRATMGAGGPGYTIKGEFNSTPHVRGIVSMARTNDPNSAGSQFFICVDAANFLDNNYTAFGQVTEGLDVVDKIVNLKRDASDNPLEENPAIMKKVTIEDGKK